MKHDITFYGISARVPNSAHFHLHGEHWWFELIPDEEEWYLTETYPVGLALAADHARCWWLDQPTGDDNEMLRAEFMDLQAEAWASIARRARREAQRRAQSFWTRR